MVGRMEIKMGPKRRQSHMCYLDGFGDNLATLGIEVIRRKVQRRQRPHILVAVSDGDNALRLCVWMPILFVSIFDALPGSCTVVIFALPAVR